MQITLTEQNRGLIVNKAVNALEKGGIVVYPSDTVYGMAVDATNMPSVNALSELKGRRADQKFSYNFSDIEMIETFTDIDEDQKKILSKYLPGPFTFIIKDDISIRIPNDTIITDITKAFGSPTTATSANLTGMDPITSIRSLDVKLYLAADLIIEDVNFRGAKPSTVVDIRQRPYKILRQGELPFED